MVSLLVPAFYSLGAKASVSVSARASSQGACRRGVEPRRPRAAGQVAAVVAAEEEEEESPRFRWDRLGSDLSEPQEEAIRGLSPKLPNRCRVLMRRVVCLPPGDENLGVVLAFWVKATKPRRADWLLVLKELKTMESPLLAEVLEHALLEDSFEANVRDYTKLIQVYGKQDLLREAEEAFRAMKARGLPCDQVILTALVDMYSKAGDLARAEETFRDMALLGLPLDARAYGSMVMAYTRAGVLDRAEELIRQAEDRQIIAGREVYKALLRAYSYRGDPEGAQRVFDAVQFAGTAPDTKLCALLVNAYCRSGRVDDAVSVTRNMRSAGLVPCDKCVALVLAAHEEAGRLEGALSFLAELEEGGVAVGREPSRLLAGWFARLGVVREVEQVLEEGRSSREKNHSTPAAPLISAHKAGRKSKSKHSTFVHKGGRKSKHSMSEPLQLK